MANNLFDDMVAAYMGGDERMRANAIREAAQAVTLAGLYRGGFFKHAAFYGGTCLRIFYGLDRYSEDLDFSLSTPSNNFSLTGYFDTLTDEFSLVGLDITIGEKEKHTAAGVLSAFLKIKDLSPGVKIKIDVDANPPPGFETEYKLFMLPYSFMTRCYTLSSSFAGKMSALLYREWRNRIKGRDWYDFEWYVRTGTAMDLAHFNKRARYFGKTATDFTEATFRELLREKILSTDIDLAKKDVIPFVDDKEKLDIWSRDYFLQVAELMKIR